MMWLGNDFLHLTPKAQAIKEKNRSVGLQQSLKLLCMKGHYQQNEKATHGKGEDLCKPYTRQETDPEYLKNS